MAKDFPDDESARSEAEKYGVKLPELVSVNDLGRVTSGWVL